jgi:hypothetical protein
LAILAILEIKVSKMNVNLLKDSAGYQEKEAPSMLFLNNRENNEIY